MTLLPELHAYRPGHDPIAGPAGPVRTVPVPAMPADPPPRLHALPGMPPAAHERGVSVRDAALALERIMARFDGGAPGPRVSLPDVERADMEALAMTATVLSLRSFGDTAKATLKALEIATQAEDSLRREQVLQYQQQMDRAVEQADKARKAGVLGVVFDWIIAVAEVVSGLFKMVTGTLTGNPLSVAGGAMDLMAGLAGLVKATANTLALVDPDNAEKHRAAADEAGKVQLSFEIAGAAVDVTSAARNLLVTRVMGKTAIACWKTVRRLSCWRPSGKEAKARSPALPGQWVRMWQNRWPRRYARPWARHAGKVRRARRGRWGSRGSTVWPKRLPGKPLRRWSPDRSSAWQNARWRRGVS